jgi:hypothetical protein
MITVFVMAIVVERGKESREKAKPDERRQRARDEARCFYYNAKTKQ